MNLRLAFTVALASIFVSIAYPADPAPTEADVERARNTVRMLDDIYKGSIVTLTDQYVNDKDTIPAGTAFKKIFKLAETKGWQTTRIIDCSGEPYDDENVANDTFEKQAVVKLLEGQPWVEAVEVREGVSHLRVATPIPVVFEKCIMCHGNYEGVEPGKAIGALTYAVPINGKLVLQKTE